MMHYLDILDEINKCLHCLLCLHVCPLIVDLNQEIISPKIIQNSLRNPINKVYVDDVIYLCLKCGACKIICPRNLDITKAVIYIGKSIFSDITTRKMQK